MPKSWKKRPECFLPLAEEVQLAFVCLPARTMDNPKLYSSANGMQKKDAREILLRFRDKINWRKHGRILDIGCGSGEVTTEIILPHLPKDFDELVGLDVSPSMIEHAESFNSNLKVRFLEFDIGRKSENILGEIAGMLRRDKTKGTKKTTAVQGREKPKPCGFDVVFSFYCLHWVPEQRLAMRNIQKCLRAGGEALLAFLVRSPIFTLYRELSKVALWKEYMQDVEDFIPFYQDSDSPTEVFAHLVRSSGFEVLELECQERQYVFETCSSLRSAIVAVNPFLSKIPPILRDEFIEECLYLTKVHQLAAFRNNSYRVTYELMIAHIRKPEF